MAATANQQPRTVLVTGGAGGIGSAICMRLAQAGARVIVLYRGKRDRVDALLQSLAAGDHLAVQADVTDSASLTRVSAEIGARIGQLHALVNTAGITRPVAHDDLDALDDALIDQIFQTNWRGAFACARAFRQLLDSGANGVGAPSVIVNVSSIAGTTGVGSNVAYCASKAALDSMTRSLARALAPKIRVVSVAPGWVLGEYAARMDPAMLEAQRARTPMGRLSSAEDVADAVYSVITHLKQTTGVIIPVDGGRPLL